MAGAITGGRHAGVHIRAARRSRHSGTTPRRVGAAVAAIVLLAAGLGALTALTYAKVGSGFTSIANQDAPLVEESTGLYFALTDMDGQVANVLLTSNDPTLAADQQDLTSYAADRQHAEHDLQQVTVTAAANPRAQQAIAQVLDALGRYEALAAEALTMNARGN